VGALQEALAVGRQGGVECFCAHVPCLGAQHVEFVAQDLAEQVAGGGVEAAQQLRVDLVRRRQAVALAQQGEGVL